MNYTTQFILIVLCVFFLLFACNKPEPERLFIFALSDENNQAAINNQQQAILSIAEQNGWNADTISNPKRITEENLQHCASVIFIHTSGATLDNFQLADLQRYMQAGGGFVGIHTEGKPATIWPWTKDAKTSQVYYPDLSQLTTPDFLTKLEAGLKTTLGTNTRDYSKATTPRSPDEDRFVKVPLIDSVWVEPIELSVLPNLDILVIQRRGELMHYDHKTKQLTETGKLDVFFQADDPEIHSEQGLVGLTLDPNFEANNFIYLFYYPTGKEVSRLSRFVFQNKKLELASEKVILEFESDRNICCHTGGALAFGPDRLLYITTGDNTSPSHQNPTKRILMVTGL